MADIAVPEEKGDRLGVWSGGAFFAIGKPE
jgi:hypothetical protein